jgi:putative holliday junction resolvase
MRYLGVDYGLKKVGLAISEGQIASPLEVLAIKSLQDGILKISQVIEREQVDRVVIGVPEGYTGEMVKKFVQELEKKYTQDPIEVIKVDETLSSYDAKRFMIDLNIPKNKRKQEDAYSAVIILQNFLNSLN